MMSAEISKVTKSESLCHFLLGYRPEIKPNPLRLVMLRERKKYAKMDRV